MNRQYNAVRKLEYIPVQEIRELSLKFDLPIRYTNGKLITKKDLILNFRKMQGKGITDIYRRVKNVFTNEFSPATEEALKKWSNYNITECTIYRLPVSVKVIVDLISGGKFSENVNKHFDDVYHLLMIMKMKDFETGKEIYVKTEKIPNIIFEQLDSYERNYKDSQKAVWVLQRSANFKTVIETAMGTLGDNWHKYTPDLYNCQNYILTVCYAMSVVGVTKLPEQLRNFIYQSPDKLFEGLKTTKTIANYVTDLGHFFGRLTGGDANSTADTAEGIIKDIPEAGEIIDTAYQFAKPLASFIESIAPDNRLPSVKFGEETGIYVSNPMFQRIYDYLIDFNTGQPDFSNYSQEVQDVGIDVNRYNYKYFFNSDGGNKSNINKSIPNYFQDTNGAHGAKYWNYPNSYAVVQWFQDKEKQAGDLYSLYVNDGAQEYENFGIPVSS